MASWFHQDELVIPITDEGVRENLLQGFEIGDPVGNPMYWVVNEHVAAGLFLLLMPVVGGLMVRLLKRLASRGNTFSQQLLDGYAGLPTPRRWATWAIVTSSLVHAVLVFTHDVSAYTALYAAGAVLLAMVARWVVLGTRPKLTGVFLIGSVVTFWFLGAPPDQVGLVTKLLEMFALALLVVPGHGVKRRFAPAGVVTLIVFTGVAAWIGAFVSAGEEGGHHGGEYPQPGTVVPYIERLVATPEEHAAADELYAQVVATLARYEDPLVAEADGYQVLPIVGKDHHADNPDYLKDGRVLDPERPETLVYAESARGPVLLGAMFQMPGLNDPGPRVGGPLTVWHSHENICFSLLPPSLISLQSPYGTCPLGAFNIPRTGEMIHAWTLPGVEDQWGHLDGEWLEQRLAQP